MKPVVFFDLDGVLANFVRGAFRAHGREIPMTEVRWDFDKQLGIPPADFWGRLEGPEFWAGLAPYDDGFELLRRVEEMLPRQQIALLTSAQVPGSVEGKRQWVKEHLPDYLPRLFTGSAKELFAAPRKILVDDHDPNVEKFVAAGGRGVVVPRPWNQYNDYCVGDGGFDVGESARWVRCCLQTM